MMKKLKYAYILALMLLSASCYKDKSNYNYTPVSDIGIAGISESYSKVSGRDTLKISPQLNSTYQGSENEYLWLRYDRTNRVDTIGRGKNLNYPVTSEPGNFTIMYFVKNKQNGIAAHTSMTLEVVSVYSRGHYILKQSEDGNTDMDFLQDDGTLITDLIFKTQGATLAGAPRSLGLLYNRAMTDPVTFEKSNATALGLITFNKRTNLLRVNDMRLIYTHDNMFFGPPDDIPYKFYTLGGGNNYLSSVGIYLTDVNSRGTGIFGPTIAEIVGAPIRGGSDYWATSIAALAMIHWDDTNHRLISNNQSTIPSLVTTTGFPATSNFDCLFMGSYINDVNVLFRDRTNTSRLVMYKVTGTAPNRTPGVTATWDIASSSKMGSASLFAANERTAQMVYFVSNNKLYYYDLVNKTEFEINPNGLPSDESITYVSNRFNYNITPKMDYLTIATLKNGNYKIYMYNILGGLPNGAPVRTVSGKGKVKETHYLIPTYVASSETSPLTGYSK